MCPATVAQKNHHKADCAYDTGCNNGAVCKSQHGQVRIDLRVSLCACVHHGSHRTAERVVLQATSIACGSSMLCVTLPLADRMPSPQCPVCKLAVPAALILSGGSGTGMADKCRSMPRYRGGSQRLPCSDLFLVTPWLDQAVRAATLH
jgi:hypothetical protein